MNSALLENMMTVPALEANLRSLVCDAATGKDGVVAEFQNLIQYAPADMKARINEFIRQIRTEKNNEKATN